MKRFATFVAIALGLAVLFCAVYTIRGFFLHGSEDKNSARVITAYQFCEQAKVESGDLADFVAGLRALDFDDPDAFAKYIFEDGDPVEIFVFTDPETMDRAYAAAAYSPKDWASLRKREANARLAQARWLYSEDQWFKSVRRGERQTHEDLRRAIVKITQGQTSSGNP